MNTYAIVLLITFLSFGLAHNVNAKLLTMYGCESHFAAEDCGGTCKQAEILGESWQADFLVDKKNNAVMKRTYIGTSTPTGDIFKNCTIFDDKNWDCSAEPYWTGKWLVYNNYKMVNGIYVQQFYTSLDIAKPVKKGDLVNNYCAK